MDIVSSSELSHVSKAAVQQNEANDQKLEKDKKPSTEIESVFLDRTPTAKR